MRRTATIAATGLLALATNAAAQVASICPKTDICFKLNIPSSTANSGNGDIFFQLSAPSSYEWVALGQGTQMNNANIFVIYANSAGNNVTLSPRGKANHVQPSFNSAAQVTLLEGSGISGGKMIANVKCSNCNSWSGGTANFKASSDNWIYAAHTSGGPKKSNDQNAGFTLHDVQDAFNWNYANAKGGNSVNPLVNSAQGTASGGGAATSTCVPRPSSGTAAATATTRSSGSSRTASATLTDDRHRSTAPTASSTHDGGHNNDKRDNINYCDDSSSSNGGFTSLNTSSAASKQRKMLIAHGTLAALAFVIFFPAGAIAIRLASFPGVVWLHGAFQVFAYLVYIAAFGLGAYIANDLDLLDNYHPIIGIVVFVGLFFQPIFGFIHHALFKKYQTRTIWSHAHLWLGRILITLGIINGGLGFKLADTNNMSSNTGKIVYAVVASVIWLIWVAASVFGELRRGSVAEHPKYTEPSRLELREISRPIPEYEHYAPN